MWKLLLGQGSGLDYRLSPIVYCRRHKIWMGMMRHFSAVPFGPLIRGLISKSPFLQLNQFWQVDTDHLSYEGPSPDKERFLVCARKRRGKSKYSYSSSTRRKENSNVLNTAFISDHRFSYVFLLVTKGEQKITHHNRILCSIMVRTSITTRRTHIDMIMKLSHKMIYPFVQKEYESFRLHKSCVYFLNHRS